MESSPAGQKQRGRVLLSRSIFTLCLAIFSLLAHAEVLLNGSGASFPFPIYAKWFKDFSDAHPDIHVAYQAKGSGAGIQDFINGSVDFAASDAAMKMEEIRQVKRGAVLLPITAGEVVLAYNLPGVESLKLPRDVYPEIFLGNITNWHDPKIVAANPDVKLPDKEITIVTRSDSSGTTYVFTGHLSAISPAFRSAVGRAKSPTWPASSNLVKAPYNDGVTEQIQQTPGAIGYVEYGYAKLADLPTAQLQNKAGKFVSPGSPTGAAALSCARFPKSRLPNSDAPNLIAWITDPDTEEAYPISSFTWLLFYANQDDDKATALRAIVEYMLSDEAQDQSAALGYIPLPREIRARVRDAASYIR